MANTESQKPKSRMSQGSTASNTQEPKAKAPGIQTLLPSSRHKNTVAIMNADLSTLGCQPTKATYAVSEIRAMTVLTPLPSLNFRKISHTSARTIAQLAPETAVRWVRPVAFMFSLNCSLRPASIPTAKPATRFAESPPNPPMYFRTEFRYSSSWA